MKTRAAPSDYAALASNTRPGRGQTPQGALLATVERAMAVPMKRFERPMLGYLTRPEMLAVLGQPGASWTSQRDHLLLVMLYNTGGRVSEIVGVRVADIVLDGAACVHLQGK